MYHWGQRLRNFTEVIRALYAHVYITLTYNRQAVISFTYKSNILINPRYARLADHSHMHLTTNQCPSWKALLHALRPPSNIVALQVEKRWRTYYHPPQALLHCKLKGVVAGITTRGVATGGGVGGGGCHPTKIFKNRENSGKLRENCCRYYQPSQTLLHCKLKNVVAQALLHVLPATPPTLSCNIVAFQVEKRCCTYYHPLQSLSRNRIWLLQVEKIQLAATCCFNLSRRILLRCNSVALQVAAICCSYYFTFDSLILIITNVFFF